MTPRPGEEGLVWSGESPPPPLSGLRRGIPLAVAAGLAVGAGYAATRPWPGTGQGFPLDRYQEEVRWWGNQSPGSLFNTFRVPQWASPFTSPGAQGGVFRIEGQYLADPATHSYLSRITGKSIQELQGLGVTVGAQGGTSGLAATAIEFERHAGSRHRGSLYSVFGEGKEATRKLLSDSIALMEHHLTDDVVLPHAKVNPALASVYLALGMGGEARAERIFRRPEAGLGALRPRLIPVPSVTGPVGSLQDLSRRTALLRAPFAFGMERLNRLLDSGLEHVPYLRDFETALKRSFGTSMKVRPGTATEMFARFGLKAGAVGAGILGLQQVDWFRRQWGIPGELMGAGLTSFGIAYVAGRVGTPRLAMMSGVASFFGQLVLPGFDQGVIPGLATLYTKADLLKTGLGEVTGLNIYRRVWDGLAPGKTDWQTGALLGLGLAASSYSSLPERIHSRYRGRFDQLPLIGRFMHRIGPVGDPGPVPLSVRQLYRQRVQGIALTELTPAQIAGARGYGFLGDWRMMRALREKARSSGPQGERGMLLRLNRAWDLAEHDHREQYLNQNPWNRSLVQRLEQIHQRWQGGGLLRWAARKLEGLSTKAVHGFFGASMGGKDFTDAIKGAGIRSRLGRVGSLFATGFLFHGILTGGLLGSLEGPIEKHETYRGRRPAAVRKGRMWEGGGTPFEGGSISHFRPSWYVALMSRARHRSVWGAEEDETSPLGKFWRRNFTYDLERRNYYDRPYPISGGFLEDVPVIGGILSATLGRLIKSPRLMHVPEWTRMGPGGPEFAHPLSEFDRPAYEMGGISPGIPQSPYSLSYLAGQQNHQFRSLEGLSGWGKDVLTKAITGSSSFFASRPVLESAGNLTSPARGFWDLNLGGLFGMSEPIRRFLLPGRSEVQDYNPIRNRMPTWIPSWLHRGDPYRRIPEGDLRLPGPGFEAMHPEIQGVDPEDYPLAYKYLILGDVGPTSAEFTRMRGALYQARQQGRTSEAENRLIDQADAMANQKLQYQGFRRPHPNAIEIPGLSRLTQRLVGGGEGLLREAAAPIEYLIPMGFRPVQKLMGQRDPIEAYEYERLYGTPLSFWDEPIRDWFRPSFYSAAHLLGFDQKPLWRERADATNGYFDQLEFVKWMRLAEQDPTRRTQFLSRARKTRYGASSDAGAMEMWRILPKEEQPFFSAFLQADPSQRARILEMVPGDVGTLYQQAWSRMDRGDTSLYRTTASTPDARLLEAKLRQAESDLGDLPSPDWVGYQEGIDMDDVRLRYVDSLGRDLHEYGLWDRQQRMLSRKPYLEGIETPIHESRGGLFGELFHLGRPHTSLQGPSELSIWGIGPSLQDSRAAFHYNDPQEEEIRSRLRDAYAR